jgi:GT2 family glycosyltransferase
VLASAPFDEGLRACEDFDFILRAIMGGARLVRTASALVYYRRHATSMSANLTNQYRHDVILQGRLHDVLLVARSYPQQRLAAKLLAYMAGLTLSLLRAEWLRGEDIALLGRYLDEATQALARLPWRTAMDGAATQALRHGGGIHSIWTAADGASLYERLRYARLRLAP